MLLTNTTATWTEYLNKYSEATIIHKLFETNSSFQAK